MASGRKFTDLCAFYQKGWCISGSSCRFTHGTSDKREIAGERAEGRAGARAGAAASTGERCKFFAIGRCLRRGNCPFVHSRDTAAAEGYQFKRNADKRPAKRLAPGTQTSPRPALRHKPAGLSQYDRTEATAGARGRRKVQGSWDKEGASSASVGGGSGGGNSSGRTEIPTRPPSSPSPPPSLPLFAPLPTPRAAALSCTASTGRTQASAARNVRAAPASVFSSARALIASAAAQAAMAEETAEAEASRSVAAVRAGVGTALSAPRAGKRNKACVFFAAGRCAFGDRCLFFHDTFCDRETEEEGGVKGVEGQAGGAGALGYEEEEGEEEENEEDEWAAKEAALDEAEKIQSRRAECGVCLEKVKGRFGILVNCRHVYCLACIKEWRQKSKHHECPQCRMLSHFVVPSATLVTDPERKERLVSEYQESRSTIPCRHFDYGVSECPYGSSCFYAHLKGDGTPAYSGRPRTLLSEPGSGGDGEERREVLMESPNYFDFMMG
eukprot:jgi/Undpi1/10768/HiC_scaffold_29.g13216.m1